MIPQQLQFNRTISSLAPHAIAGKSKPSTVIFLAFFLVFQTAVFGQESLTKESRDALTQLFANFENQPGIAVGIFRGGKTLYSEGFGFSNLDDNVVVTPHTVFETASVSKQFTAACIYLLEMEGLLALDDPIQRFLPDFPTYPEGVITIRHLLHHTSGIRGYLRLLHARGQSWDTNLDNQQCLHLLQKQQKINFTPGTQYAYSNSGYVLLSLIVEKASGMPLGAYAHDRIFEPLDMKHTFVYEDPTKIIKNRAIGYERTDRGYRRAHHYNAVNTGDGGVQTTIEDLYKWSENFKTTKVGGPGFSQKMLTTGTLNDGTELVYAGGLILGDYDGLLTFGHDGHWAGFRSLFFKFPEQDVTFVILSNNASTNVWGLVGPMTDIILAAEKAPIRNAPITSNPIKPNPEEMNRLTGTYFNYTNGYSRIIELENDTLQYRRPNGRVTKLAPLDKNRYTFLEAPQVILSFNRENKQECISLTIGDQPPIKLIKYTPKSYAPEELSKFTGHFYSTELEVTYEIVARAEELCIQVNNAELVCLSPVMEHLFADEHFGYLRFESSDTHPAGRFTLNDELARDLKFTRVAPPTSKHQSPSKY